MSTEMGSAKVLQLALSWLLRSHQTTPVFGAFPNVRNTLLQQIHKVRSRSKCLPILAPFSSISSGMRVYCVHERTPLLAIFRTGVTNSRPSMQDSMTVPSTGPRLGSGAQNERRRNTEAAQWFAKHLRGRVPRARCAHNGGRGNSLIDL